MTHTMKKAISLLLVLMQLFVLFPVLQPQAEAAQSEQETPVLNETVVGTVKFQSFNFLGDNDTGEDGTDYRIVSFGLRGVGIALIGLGCVIVSVWDFARRRKLEKKRAELQRYSNRKS